MTSPSPLASSPTSTHPAGTVPVRRLRRWGVWAAATAILTASAFVTAAAPAPVAAQHGVESTFRFSVGRDAPVGRAAASFTAVAAGPDGTLYAVEPSLGRVVRYARDGEVIGAFGGLGSAPGRFADNCSAPETYPDGPCTGLDVAVGPSGDVFVADAAAGAVQRFTAWGQPLGYACPPGCLDVATTIALAVGGDGTLAVALRDLDRVVVLSPVGTTIGAWTVRWPGDVALDAEGRVFVAEMASAQVGVFAPHGRRLASLGHGGIQRPEGPGVFAQCVVEQGRGLTTIWPCDPVALSLDRDGALLVLDRRGRVHRIDPRAPDDWTLRATGLDGARGLAVDTAGRLVAAGGGLRLVGEGAALDEAWPAIAVDRGALYAPTDIAVVPPATVRDDPELTIVDAASHRVYRIWGAGLRREAWGGQGAGPGRLAAPQAVALAPDRSVLVADTGNDRLQRFSYEGLFRSALDRVGSGGARLAQPRDVAVDADGIVYAVDAAPGRIARFGADDTPLDPWLLTAAAGEAPPDLVAIAVTADRAIVVADAANRRVVRLGSDGAVFGDEPIVAPDGAKRVPLSVAVAPDGRATVGTADGLILDLGGEAGTTVRATAGCGLRHVTQATALAYGPDGTLHVVDGPGRRILAFVPGAHETVNVRGYSAVDALGDAVFEAPGAVVAVGDVVVAADSAHRRLQPLTTEGVAAGRPQSAPGCQGANLGTVSALAAAPGGRLVAADAEFGRVVERDRHGTTSLRAWGTPGALPIDLGSPVAALATGDGGVWLAAEAPRRILRFGPDGASVASWAVPMLDVGLPKAAPPVPPPAGIDALVRAADGTVALFDIAGRRVYRLRDDGSAVAAWSLPAEVVSPRSLAAAADGSWLVADTARHHIARLDADGRWLGALGEAAGLAAPERVAAMGDGRIVVVQRVTETQRLPSGSVLSRRFDEAVVLDAGGARLARWDLTGLPRPVFHRWRAVAATDAGSLWLVADEPISSFDGRYAWSFAPVVEVGIDGAVIQRADVPIDPPHQPRVPTPWNLDAPIALAPRPDGGLWIAGSRVPLLAHVAADAKVVRRLWTTRDGPGGLTRASGVAVAPGPDGQPRLFVADSGAHRVVVFAWDGAFEREWSAGPDGLALNAPHQMAVAADGTLWVADSGNHRLAHFAADGTPLGAVGALGGAPGQLRAPRGVAVAADGTLRVADTGNRRLQALATDGAVLAVWGTGAEVGAVQEPAGLAFDDQGQLWVADTLADRLHVFGPTPSDRWHVRTYADAGLVDGPLDHRVLDGPTLDLDWSGGPPAPGVPATGFGLRAEARIAAPAWPERWLLSVRGAAHASRDGRDRVAAASGDPAAAVFDTPGADTWLRVDFAALRTQRPSLHVGPMASVRYFPAALNGATRAR